MTGTAADWRLRAHRLAQRIAAGGVLTDPMWTAAIEAVPRHVFVPRFYAQQPDGDWAETSAEVEGWLDAVYDDVPLVTELAETVEGQRVTVSSSTKPGLMVRMLEALDLRDGHRVLEIGTGTGYNAALLAHRLGDERVFSVDIDAGLVDAARERLGELGYAPTLHVVHGAHGLPEHAPFDRIIATCSVPAVPWAWAEQVCHGSLVLVDVKRGMHAGNLVALRRYSDRLEGRFLSKWAGFMAMRESDNPPTVTHLSGPPSQGGSPSATRLEPQPWTATLPWFLAQARLPRRLVFGYQGFDESGPEWATFDGDDGSWCVVRMQADEHGWREVRQGGPIAVWDRFEQAHQAWDALGRPGWDRFGLTVLPNGHHSVWLDEPGGAYRWSLPPM